MPRPRSPKLDLSRATVSALKKMQEDQPLTSVFDLLEEDTAYLQFMPSVLLGVVALVVLAALMTVCCSLGFDRKPTKHAGEKGKTASGGAPGTLSAAVRNAAIAGKPDAVLDFLDKTSANARDDGGATLLHHCATHGHAELVRAALACYGGGSAVWIFENVVCGVTGEEGGGWPMQWAHLHAVWHAGACLGTYHFIQFCSARRQGALGFNVRAKGGDTWRSPLSYVAHVAADDRDKRE